MDYRLENLSEDDFEGLVNVLCQKVLGTGTVSFTKGRDGGRDGRFNGIANSYPSKTMPWQGKFVIQAKHTTDYQASCSDKRFFENQSSIIKKEILKIKNLKERNEIDNYLLFTNRKETSKREDAINHIKVETGLINVDILGVETINSFLRQNKDIVRTYKLDQFIMPFDFQDKDIRDIILMFNSQLSEIQRQASINENRFNYILKEKKNNLNNLDQNYYENRIRKKSIEYFAQIDAFLQNPINNDYAKLYENFAFEIGNKIEARIDSFENFGVVFEFLFDEILERNKEELRLDSRLIWIFLHHLYFNCHIGRTE